MRYVILAVLCIATLMVGCKLSINGVEAPYNAPIPSSNFKDDWGYEWDGKTITNLRRHSYPIVVMRHGKPHKKLLPNYHDPLGKTIRVTRRGVHLYFKVNKLGRLKYLPGFSTSSLDKGEGQSPTEKAPLLSPLDAEKWEDDRAVDIPLTP